MENSKQKISLGFTSQTFEPGIHICQIFNDDEERHGALLDFIVSGLQAGEDTACFSEKETEASLSAYFEQKGIVYKDVLQNGTFALSKTADVYFEGERFEPQRMIDLLHEFYDNSLMHHKTGARVIGEMLPIVSKMNGGDRLLEYEAKVSILLREYPINAVCQYDARLFNGATIMDILRVHPYMIVRGAVVHNPFYIEPEEFLAKINN